MLRAYLAQSILHALVGGLVVGALLRAWRVEDGTWRLRLRLVALTEPILVLPFYLAIPWRGDAAFAGTWALFASERWNQLRIGGAGVGDLAVLCASGLGAALFLRDAGPPLLEALRGTPHAARPGLAAPVPPDLVTMATRHARALGITPPEIRLLRSRLPVLLCEHARQPVLVVSIATLEQLDPVSLDAAIAHEIAHAARRDPLWGYALIVARALTFFNPAAQWLARTAVEDIERRADQLALALTHEAPPLAHAIRLLSLAAPPTSPEVADRFERLFWQSRVAAVHRRCDRLLETSLAVPLRHGTLRVLLTAAGLGILLFFVV
jgi:Zn-dependent protease with chaperone function